MKSLCSKDAHIFKQQSLLSPWDGVLMAIQHQELNAADLLRKVLDDRNLRKEFRLHDKTKISALIELLDVG